MMLSTILSPTVRFVLSLSLGLLGLVSILDLSRVRSGTERETLALTRKVDRSESERMAELLGRLRTFREKIGETAYKRLEDEYLQRLKKALEKEAEPESKITFTKSVEAAELQSSYEDRRAS